LNYEIIAGHTRWKAAKSLGLSRVPVILLDLDEKKKNAFSIADNKTAEIADWDYGKLRDILNSLRMEDMDISPIGFTNQELRRILKIDDMSEDEILKSQGKVRTRTGDIWLAGAHRLLCGDSRDETTVKYLMQGNTIDFVFGGPPYFNQRTYANWGDFNGYLYDMKRILRNCWWFLKDGGVLVWNIANDCREHLDLTSFHSMAIHESGFRHLDTIMWLKTGANFAIPRNLHIHRNRCYYPAFQWEALLVYQKPGVMPKMTREGMEYMRQFCTNVWEIPSVTHQLEEYSHPAVCPVEIPYRCMQAYTGENAVIFEPFGGSGTTLIAAEQASRKAFILERHPGYCDIIINRWEKMTGQKAELERRDTVRKLVRKGMKR
ncbi:MAG: DNA methyltransferase, partial [bacterium]